MSTLVRQSIKIALTPANQLDGHYLDGNTPSSTPGFAWDTVDSILQVQVGTTPTFTWGATFLNVPVGFTPVYGWKPGFAPPAGFTLNTSTGAISYSGSGVGSSTVVIRATYSTYIADSNAFIIQSIASQSTDTKPTTVPYALVVAVTGVTQVTLLVQPPADIKEGTVAASGLKEVRFRQGGSFIAAVAASPGVSLVLAGTDLGTVGAAGSTTQTGANWAMVAQGTQFGSTVDDGQYAMAQITGDFDIFCEVHAATGTTSTGTAGIAVRETMTAGSKALFNYLSATRVRARGRLNDNSGSTASNPVTGPTWGSFLWTSRRGDVLSSYYGSDSNNFALHDQRTLPMAAAVWVGLFGNAGVASASTLSVDFRNVCIQNLAPVQYVVNGLTAGSTYTFDCYGRDLAATPNDSAACTSVSITVPAVTDTTAPTVPGQPTVTAGSDTVLNLSWVGSTDTQTGVSGYNVYHSTTSGGTYTKINGATLISGLSYSHSGLTQLTTHYYKITAVDGSGNESAQSTSGNGTTNATPGADTTAPAVNNTGSAAGISTTVIRITHSASTDASGISQYRIYVSTTLGGTYIENTALRHTGLTVDFTGLTASTNRYFKLTGVDGAGNESVLSTVFTGTTLATPPTNILIKDINFNSGTTAGLELGHGNTPAIVTTNPRGGTYCMECFVDRINSPTNYRTEAAFNYNAPLFKTVYYGWSIWVPTTFAVNTFGPPNDTPWAIITQMHNSNSVTGDGNPVLSFQMYPDFHSTPVVQPLWMQILGDENRPIVNGSYRTKKSFFIGNVTKGVWMDIMVRVNWDYNIHVNDGGTGHGFCQVKFNDVLVVDYVGQISFSDTKGPYPQAGWYMGWESASRKDSNTQILMRFDKFAVAYESDGATWDTVSPAVRYGARH